MIYLTEKDIELWGGQIPVFNKKIHKMDFVKAPLNIVSVIFTAKDIQIIAKADELTFAETLSRYSFINIGTDEGSSLYAILVN